ncbi:MAG: hypothetical protein JNK82_14635 [Myxococcaceae bacterium]|nr:hypothetical protein [Myxococcaceae bacterium]
MKNLVLTVAAALALAGCQKKAEETTSPPPPPRKVIANPSPSMPEGHPALKDLAIGSRGPRRMSVDQIERSLDEIGGLPAGSIKLPADLAVTLGRPDYKRVNEEQLQPTPLFMKFMLDITGFYCPSLAQFEATRPAAERIYTRFATVDENIRFMLLRFTGIEGADADPYVVRLKAAYDTGSQSTTVPLAGYQAVCASLFTSPEFLLY